MQLTPLARPVGWARFTLLVACHRLCRSMNAASGATDAVRWASNRSRSADVGEPNIPGIFPGSRAYRAAGHISGQPGIFPDSRAYRAAGHISRQPDIFPGNRAYFRATGHISGQPGIFPGSRTAGHTGQPGIPGNRTCFHTYGVHIFCGRFNISIRINIRTSLRTLFTYYFIRGHPTLLCSGRRWRGP